MQPCDMKEQASNIADLIVSRNEWITLPAETSILNARDDIRRNRAISRGGQSSYSDDAIIVLIDDGEAVGVLEIGDLLS